MATVSLLAESVVPASVGWMEWDVANHVKDALNSSLSNVDFLIRFETEQVAQFYSLIFYGINAADSANRPQLIINSSTINANKDNYINEKNKTANYDYDSVLKLDVFQGEVKRALISFPLTGITSVSSATLRLKLSSISDSSGLTVGVYKLTRSSWDEGESSWNYYNVTPDTLTWTTAGGDYTDTGEVGEESEPSSSGILRVGSQAFRSLRNDV